MECNQIHSFCPIEKGEEDDDQVDIWRAQRELDDWVEEEMNLDKPTYCNENKEVVNIFCRCFSLVLKIVVFVHLGKVSSRYLWKILSKKSDIVR